MTKGLHLVIVSDDWPVPRHVNLIKNRSIPKLKYGYNVCACVCSYTVYIRINAKPGLVYKPGHLQ